MDSHRQSKGPDTTYWHFCDKGTREMGGTPYGFMGMFDEENGGLVGENQGLSGCELLRSVRGSIILNRYKLKYQIIQNTATMQFPIRYNAAEVDKQLREDYLFYLRDANRLLRNEIGWRK